jgi:hypothetical protein
MAKSLQDQQNYEVITMFILVILVFMGPQPTKDSFVFVDKKECERAGSMLKAISKFPAIIECQQVV